MSQLPHSTINSQDYRLGVGIMLVNHENLVFTAKRIDTRSEAWQMPQGGIDANETPQEAAFRELKEEIGTNTATIIAQSSDWYSYDLPESLVSQLWEGRYRGQRQRWFLMRFQGRDEDINIATQSPEFLEWRWSDLNSLPDLIVPFKRPLYLQLVNEFKPFLVRA